MDFGIPLQRILLGCPTDKPVGPPQQDLHKRPLLAATVSTATTAGSSTVASTLKSFRGYFMDL